MQGNVNIPDSTITSALTFRNLVLMNMQQLTNFPYIEKDFDALTDYELLCLVVKFLNDVIANQNEQNDSITRMYESFLALQDYVNNTKDELEDAFNNLDDYVKNYFDNLDVQEEINNKLDQMLEDGVLEQIIEQFLQSTAIWCFNTVADMKTATNLIDGSYARTLGYYSINDGGGSLYKIVDDNTLVADNGSIIGLNNGLFAKLIIENNTINIKQLGAKPLIVNDEKTDLKPYIDLYIRMCETNIYKLYIPSGVWTTSPLTITSDQGMYIYGDENFGGSNIGTIITSIDNQSHILQLGTNVTRLSHWVLKNITFSNNIISYSNGKYTFTNYYHTISNSLVKLLYACFGISDNIMFDHIKGETLNISTSWENYFKLLNFRNIDNLGGSIIRFSESDNTLVSSPNISANNFEKIMFENIHGHLIQADINCNFINNHIGIINFEDTQYTPNNETYVNFNSTTIEDYNEATDEHLSVINVLGQFCCVIDSIELNNFSKGYFVSDNKKYAYDTIINASNNGFNPNSIINNIHVVGMNKKSRILKQNTYYPRKNCVLKIANVNTGYTDYPLYLDVNGYTYIECDSLIDKNDGYLRYVPTLHNGDVIPFYKGAKLYSNNNYGGLYYDADANNDLHLVIKPFNTDSSDVYQSTNNVLITGENIKIRAKVPSGTTAVLVLEADGVASNDRYIMSLVGTGNYEIYDFTDIPTTNYPYGKIGAIRLNNTSEIGKDCYLDYYKFY